MTEPLEARIATLEHMVAELIRRLNKETLDSEAMRKVITALSLDVRDLHGGYVHPVVNGQLTSIPHYIRELALVEAVILGFTALKRCYDPDAPRDDSEPTYDLDFGA